MVITRCEQIDARDTWRVTIVCVCASQKAATSSFADEGIRMDITHVHERDSVDTTAMGRISSPNTAVRTKLPRTVRSRWAQSICANRCIARSAAQRRAPGHRSTRPKTARKQFSTTFGRLGRAAVAVTGLRRLDRQHFLVASCQPTNVIRTNSVGQRNTSTIGCQCSRLVVSPPELWTQPAINMAKTMFVHENEWLLVAIGDVLAAVSHTAALSTKPLLVSDVVSGASKCAATCIVSICILGEGCNLLVRCCWLVVVES